MPPRGEPKFRFELLPNAAGEASAERKSKGKQHKSRSHGSRGRPVELRDDEGGDWLKVDMDDVCALVPHMPRAAVHAACARERARGASVEDAINELLTLTLSAQVAAAVPPPPPIAAGPIATPNAGAPEAEPPLIAELPDEVLSAILTQIGYAQVGRLRCVERSLHEAVGRWLRVAVRQLRVHGALRRWADARVLGLIRATGSLDLLSIDCTAPADGGGSPSARSAASLLSDASAQMYAGAVLRPGVGFGSFEPLFQLPPLRALRSLALRDAARLTEAHVLALVDTCKQLTALSLVSTRLRTYVRTYVSEVSSFVRT